MSVPQQQRLEELFTAALELRTPEERTLFLRSACIDDDLVRGQVEELIEAHEQASGFLQKPLVDADATMASLPAGPEREQRIGPYRLLEQLGEGGFGVVYLAEQLEPVRRKVALKVIKLGMDTRQVIARFEAERQALALMDHPSIARVLDAGATETGRPYFVMELVRGVTITKYCKTAKLPLPDCLALFIKVCDAVQHAHQKGVIHRDIKPSNVLVTLREQEPVPKVIDFGIAKATTQRLTEKTLYTEFRQFVGTPEYMSPDQAEISGLEVDTRTDIYSLGVLLYELLTGTTPFGGQALHSKDLPEIKRVIREVEPPKPSTRIEQDTKARRHEGTKGEDSGAASLRASAPSCLRASDLHGDLDWIVMKALEKDRTRRYQTVSDLARDVERHLRNEPVAAGPPGFTYRLSKFVRRNRGTVLAGAVVGGGLVAGLALATFGYVQARHAQDALRVERDAAEVANGFLREMLASVDPSRALGREVTFRYVLDEAARKINAGAMADQPLVQAQLRTTLAETYEALGFYADAEASYRAARQVYERVHGPQHADTLRAQSKLIGLLNAQLRHAEAEALGRQTVDALTLALGAEAPDTLAARSRLGIALAELGKLEEAARTHESVLEAQRRGLGERHIDTLRSLANLGATYRELQRPEAEPLLRQALNGLRGSLGEGHPEVLAVMTSLALTLERHGMLAAASQLFEQTVELHRQILGRHHPRTQIAMNHLLRVLRREGDVERARPLVAERLEGLKQAADRTDADALAVYNYAVELLTCEPADLRDARRALPQARRAVELTEERDPVQLETLAMAYEANDEIDHAIETQQKAIARARISGMYSVEEMDRKLVRLLARRGRLGEVFANSVGSMASAVGDMVAADFGSVGGVLMGQAAKLMAEADFIGAESALRACLATRQKSLPGDHWAVAEATSMLGAALAGQRKYAEAESLLLESYQRLEKDTRAPAQLVREAHGRIVALYEAWGNADRAAFWRERSPQQAWPAGKGGDSK